MLQVIGLDTNNLSIQNASPRHNKHKPYLCRSCYDSAPRDTPGSAELKVHRTMNQEGVSIQLSSYIIPRLYKVNFQGFIIVFTQSYLVQLLLVMSAIVQKGR